VVAGVGDVDVARGVDGHTDRRGEAGGAARAVRIAEARRSAGDRDDVPRVDPDLADVLVGPVGDVQAGGAVVGHRKRVHEARRGAVAVGGAAAGRAGQRAHLCAADHDAADHRVGRVGDVQVGHAVADHVARVVEAGGGAQVVDEPDHPGGAGEGGDAA